jgi:hypothetical protein
VPHLVGQEMGEGDHVAAAALSHQPPPRRRRGVQPVEPLRQLQRPGLIAACGTSGRGAGSAAKGRCRQRGGGGGLNIANPEVRRGKGGGALQAAPGQGPHVTHSPAFAILVPSTRQALPPAVGPQPPSHHAA